MIVIKNKFNILQAIAIILCIVWAFHACDDSDDPVEPEVTLQKPEVGATETSQFVTVICEGEWTLTVSYPAGTDEWCSLNTTDASGNGSRNNIILYYDVNDSEESREAYITLQSGGRTVQAVLTQKKPEGPIDPDPDPETPGYPTSNWTELPAQSSNTSYMYATHYAMVNSTQMRNYSLCYDINEKISYWVAYPLHAIYTTGSVSGSTWSYDPKIPSRYQADLSISSWSGNVQYGYERGHQIASADRKATYLFNSQTRYSTNATPQLSDFNGAAWSKLESWVRDRMTSDTLYVVTGAVLRTVNGNETVNYDSDKAGVQVAIPNYYYKVLVQKHSANSTGTDYRAIGFWYRHETNNDVVSVKYTKTIREIENLSGFDFFANLPDEVQNALETTNRPQDWNIDN